jgi:CopG antitoxin of type II toxin-antitoxin system
MKRSKSSISKARLYTEIGEFWDEHDLSDFWGKTRRVRFEVEIESEVTYFPIEKSLSEKIQLLARKQGISSNTLVNLWLEQKLREQASSDRAVKDA